VKAGRPHVGAAPRCCGPPVIRGITAAERTLRIGIRRQGAKGDATQVGISGDRSRRRIGQGSVKGKSLQALLNEQGRQGWELVGCAPEETGGLFGDVSAFVLVFKRP
jgi:hypothetical protein